MLGLLTGLLTVASGLWLEPGLQAWLSLPPSYSSLSTHGVPALLGSLTGVLTAALAEEKADSGNPEYYGVLLYCLYPSRVPPADWTCLTNATGEAVVRCPSSGEEVRAAVPGCLDLQLPGDHRTAGDQAAWQVHPTRHIILIYLARMTTCFLPFGGLTCLKAKHLPSPPAGSDSPVHPPPGPGERPPGGGHRQVLPPLHGTPHPPGPQAGEQEGLGPAGGGLV